MDKTRFELAKNKIISVERERKSIGTLSEKTVHAILKNYMESDEDYHEIPVNGYVADIYKEGKIIEIQTANFNKMRDKLSSFLNEYEVTIVYPIPHIKWLSWINEETGEVTQKRKSPQKGNIYEAFYELYKIKSYLKHPNLKFKIILIDVEEFRLLNGWSENRKRGSSRFDRIPVELVSEIDICQIDDYVQLIPIELPDIFDTRTYAKAAHINISIARLALNILNYVGSVEKVGKKGNAILYQVKE